MLDANAIKVWYENSIKYQFLTRTIDVKQSTITFNNKYIFLENMKCEVQKMQVQKFREDVIY
jgi:hypothetical protein